MSNVVGLSGIPETMLWTLHNRAVEAKRSDGILHDPDCVRIYDSIDYDYERSFGKPSGIHAERARIFDAAVRGWLREHPAGTVVELGAGLETQFQRCDNGTVSWLCVDVEESIAVRDRYLPAGPRCRHIPCSALDPRWIDELAPGPVFLTAQGLFMYFDEPDVRGLITTIAERLPGAELMFDTIPPLFSRMTMRGFAKTANYTTPPMPWGITPADLPVRLRAWTPRIVTVAVRNYSQPRGASAPLLRLVSRIPLLRNQLPAITKAAVKSDEFRPTMTDQLR
ncbi:class I SAM-dependent methyltransferase [Nocardia sp. NBC_01503]|uniref:class I SAM-dependent methyltransferase n=1 Tax=Nocardia sp. NBC_01503 TaxID=2975997 RepID=UPI002E7C255B|nr:class I SAM-dependent methyltransferase [Nocardia sp. NBC_01503]WTL33406.1 class I SAM-dependent methyltransferase [Nocardia sp. NBC_01503]